MTDREKVITDLISKAPALDAIFGCFNILESKDIDMTVARTIVKGVLDAIPPVDATPMIHGRWIKMTGMMPPEYHGHYECSECQWHMKGLRNSWTREEELSYCPNCGAKMEVKHDD